MLQGWDGVAERRQALGGQGLHTLPRANAPATLVLPGFGSSREGSANHIGCARFGAL